MTSPDATRPVSFKFFQDDSLASVDLSVPETAGTMLRTRSVPVPFASRVTSGGTLSSKRFRTPSIVDHPLICLSHLRWDFVLQRPQHLLTRAAQAQDVIFVEEPHWHSGNVSYVHSEVKECGVLVVTPHLAESCRENADMRLEELLSYELRDALSAGPILWYYTPMALAFSKHWPRALAVYDCMDELSAFKGAHPELLFNEASLMKAADVVFTGGQSLYEAKKNRHHYVHAMPSSIDCKHFGKAREKGAEPKDQADISGKKVGFFGVVDERFDIELLKEASESRPDWQFIVIGPVVKIDERTLPRAKNVHYLGSKSYAELPDYLRHWDVAILPFALNESTKFISPTKTPEYLAGGKPVVSTAIRDVISPYENLGLVEIAHNSKEFVKKIESSFTRRNDPSWKNAVDSFLSRMSWDKTWLKMTELMNESLRIRTQKSDGFRANANG